MSEKLLCQANGWQGEQYLSHVDRYQLYACLLHCDHGIVKDVHDLHTHRRSSCIVSSKTKPTLSCAWPAQQQDWLCLCMMPGCFALFSLNSDASCALPHTEKDMYAAGSSIGTGWKLRYTLPAICGRRTAGSTPYSPFSQYSTGLHMFGTG